MKTIKSKFLLPVAAFMIAIAAAFASQPEASVDFAPVQGYIYQNGVCIPKGKCDNDSSKPLCTIGGVQVFGKTDATSCLEVLHMQWRP